MRLVRSTVGMEEGAGYLATQVLDGAFLAAASTAVRQVGSQGRQGLCFRVVARVSAGSVHVFAITSGLRRR